MSKKRVFWLLTVVFVLLASAGCFYFLKTKYHFFADQLNEEINSQIIISQIPLFSDGSDKSTTDSIDLLIPRGGSRSFEILVENQSTAGYSHITIGKSNFVSSDGESFPTSNIDEKIVHKWPQKLVTWGTANTFIPQAVSVEELLVENDAPALTAPTDAKYNGDTFFSNDIGILPEQLLKKNGDSASESSSEIKSTLASGATKKFFFNVNSPNNLSGAFSGEISLVDRGSNTVISKFTLNLTISNMHLDASTGLTNGCYVNDRITAASDGTPPSSSAHSYISESLFRQRINTIKEYGCNSAIIRVGKYANYNLMAQVISESGMTGPIILHFYGTNDSGLDYYDTVSSATSVNKLRNIITDINNNPNITNTILFYGIDEPNTDEKYPLHQEKVRNTKAIVSSIITDPTSKIKNDVTTSASATTWNNLFAAGEQYQSNYPIDHFSSSVFITERTTPIKNGTYTPKTGESFYYQGWNEVQKADGSYQPINRYLSGIGLKMTGLKGSYANPIYGYHGVGDSYKPYYDDYTGENSNVWQKPMFIFYPASDGFITTLQAEAMKQGVADLKYYAKYQALKAGTIPDDRRQELEQLSAQIDTNLALYQFSVNNYTLPTGLTAKKMDDTADLLTQYIATYYRGETPPSNPPVISSINVSDDQVVTTNPYVVNIKVADTTAVSRVEFYVDDNLIGTSTLPDVEGNYSCAWDTSKYHSLLKIIVYGTDGSTAEVARNTTVQLNSNDSGNIVPVLPKTGEAAGLLQRAKRTFMWLLQAI